MADAGEDNRTPVPDGPDAHHEPDESLPDGTPRHGIPEVPTPRRGPAVLQSDSWDTVPILTSNRAYEGRRRADPITVRRWWVIGAILAALAALIAIPLALSSSDEEGTAAPAPPAPPVTARPTTTTASIGEATSFSPSLSPTTTTTQATRPRTTAAFQPLAFEGEDADLDGSAGRYRYDGASGGFVAYRIGDWNDRDGDGVLTIRNIAIPTGGRYRITLITVHPDGESQRFARLNITGVNVITLTFNGGSKCCQTTNVDVTLTAGTKTLTFTHTNRRAPSVDRIVISRL
jgi:hypothetical protein